MNSHVLRIASLAPSVTVMLQELGMAEQIVACTYICPLPATKRQNVAVGTFSALDEEKLAAAKPDIVVTATLVQQQGAQRLQRAGFSVLHLDPRRLTDIAESYVELGQAVGAVERAIALRDEFLHALSHYSLQTTHYSLRVYMEEWSNPPYVSGNWVPDMVVAAGGTPILVQPGKPSREITTAEVVAADPEVIVQHVCLSPGYDWTAVREKLRQELLARSRWDELTAVKTRRVFSVDDSLFNMPTRQVLQGIQELQNLFASVGKRVS